MRYQQANNYARADGIVGINTWKSMGLHVNATLEEEFAWSGTKGNSVISVSLSGDSITIDYFPKFYVVEEYIAYRNEIVHGLEFRKEYVATRAVERSVYGKYLEHIIEGFNAWAGNYYVQGVFSGVTVNVHPTRAASRSEANVVVTTDLINSRVSVVETAFLWDVSIPPSVKLNETTANDKWVKNNAMHEFGHVLGIFDAYGYVQHWKKQPLIGDVINPVARPGRAPQNGIMRDNSNDPIVTGTEIEMLLYAWTQNMLQTYEKGLFGVESQAFFR
jgi:hypothetical protein